MDLGIGPRAGAGAGPGAFLGDISREGSKGEGPGGPGVGRGARPWDVSKGSKGWSRVWSSGQILVGEKQGCIQGAYEK